LVTGRGLYDPEGIGAFAGEEAEKKKKGED